VGEEMTRKEENKRGERRMGVVKGKELRKDEGR